MAKWTRNHKLEIGIVLSIIGLAATIVSFVDNWANTTPAWLAPYHDLMRSTGQGDFNLFVVIAGPIILIWGAFTAGEQIILRRRFERLLDTPKKSEFAARRTDLEDIAKRLPEGYRKRVKDKEHEFSTTRRSA